MKEKIFKLLVLPSVSNMQQVINRFPFPIALTKGHFKNLEFNFHSGKTTVLHKGTDLRDFSFVWLCSSWGSRDLAYAIQLYLKKHKIPHTQVEKGTSKITDQMIFVQNGIQTPDALFIGRKDVENCLKQIKEACGYPLVIKDIRGSQGAHLIKVRSEEDFLIKIKDVPKHKKYLFQQYIPNEYDWGIMVANGVVVSGQKRYHCEGEFRNNICNGAEEIFIDSSDIPFQIKEMAIKAGKALGLAWSRSDIIIDKNTQKPYVLETNRLPGLTSKTSDVEGAYTFLSAQIISSGKKRGIN